jgi:hypothetical protein
MCAEQTDDSLSVIPSITIFGKKNCRFCDEAKKAFASVELPFVYKILDEELCLETDPATGLPRPLHPDWRVSGMIELLSLWTLHDGPIPFIVIGKVGYAKLASALDAVKYRDRKRIIHQRERDAKTADSRSNAQ